MIRLKNIVKNYGAHEILRGIDWSIPPRTRVGLIGPNGSGKTTLLRLISKIEDPDAGTLDIGRECSIGYLPQEGARLPTGSLLEALLEPFGEILEMERELARMHEEMATAQGERLNRLTRLSGELQHRFEVAGGFDLEVRAKAILGGLGFAAQDHARPLKEFSGGYRMRAALGSLLLQSPEILLLDEPTNHLDLDAIGWLESFLAESRSTLLIVSHDRQFLNRLVSTVAELERGRLRVWAGNYDKYRSEKDKARELARKKAAQEAHRIGDLERFVERFRYKATKARQVQSRIKMLEKMERTELMEEEHSWNFRFPSVTRSSQRVVTLTDVRKSYGRQQVLKGVDLNIDRGDRVALVGPNGCGKSTLLQILAGRLQADGGKVEPGEKVVLHHFSQHVLDTLTPGRTVLEEMQAWAPDKAVGQLRSLLGIFQFSQDEVFKKVEVLSGGEKNRLALARLTLDPGNFLVLDEPTNHLDLPTREALEEALASFGGSLLFVSHDRYFINKVATQVAEFQDGKLKVYSGGYDEFLRGSGEAQPKSRTGTRKPSGVPTPRERRREEAESRNRKGRSLRSARSRVTKVEEKILPLETRLKEIESILANPDTYQEPGRAQKLGEERKAIEVDLAYLYDAWDQATAALQESEDKPD